MLLWTVMRRLDCGRISECHHWIKCFSGAVIGWVTSFLLMWHPVVKYTPLLRHTSERLFPMPAHPQPPAHTTPHLHNGNWLRYKGHQLKSYLKVTTLVRTSWNDINYIIWPRFLCFYNGWVDCLGKRFCCLSVLGVSVAYISNFIVLYILSLHSFLLFYFYFSLYK